MKSTMRYHHTPLRMAAINKSTNHKCWRECGEKGTLVYKLLVGVQIVAATVENIIQ